MGESRNFFVKSPRLLMGPGPSPVPFEVRRAMAEPVIGHLDPQFLAIMDRVQDMLRKVFGTDNRLTIPVSGTGSAGMETAMVNFIEPQDRILVVSSGLFGRRIKEAALKLNAEVIELEVPWGEAARLEDIEEQLKRHANIKLVAIVKAETSTGVLQPLSGLGSLVHRHGALLLVDAVTAIGGMPIDVDDNEFDIVFAGTQKCLSAPPGLSPFTVSERALKRLDERRSPVPSWYLDLNQVRQYYGKNRTYHHTAPISMIYGLAQALELLLEEGLSEAFDRHRRVSSALWSGLEAMGLELLVDNSVRLPSLTTVRIPGLVDDVALRKYLLDNEGIEIGGGLGPLAGKIWRIGVMGHGALPANGLHLLAALHRGLEIQGVEVPLGLNAFQKTFYKE